MNKISIILSLYIMIFTALIPAAFADVIEPGMKNINYNYKISNIDDYPEYIFLAHGVPSPSLEIITSKEFSFYKLSTVSIYAVKKSDLNEEELKNMDDLQNFFNNNSKLISSDIKLDGSYGNIGMDNPLDNVLLELEITSINDNKMNIKKSKVIYTYSDGSTQEELIENQDVLPEPSKNSISNIYFLIPVLAITAIGIIFISRKLR